MPEMEQFIEIAGEVLVTQSPLGRDDTFLLDHSKRVMRLALKLAEHPEAHDWRIDRLCLGVAALFHQAATVRLEEERRTSTVYATATMSAEDVKDYSAELVGDRLSGRLTPRQVSHVQEIIRQAHTEGTELAEALILSDADNLDDIGTLGTWRNMRRNLMEGRGIEEALSAWHNRQQYGYWEARIRSSLHLEASRRLAESRLGAAQMFMDQLGREHEAEDLPEE